MEQANNKILTQISNSAIFSGVPHDQLSELLDCAVEKDFQKDQCIVKEGDISNYLYFVVHGCLAVLRIVDSKKYNIAEIGAGSIVGDLEYAHQYSTANGVCGYFADVVALEPTKLLEFDIEKLKKLSFFENIETKILANIADSLSSKLRKTDSDIITNLENEITQKEDKILNGTLIFWILFLSSLYILFLRLIIDIKPYLVSLTPLTIASAVIYFIAFANFIVTSKRPAAFFGLTFNNWKKSVIESVFYTFILMIFFMIIKYILIISIQKFHNLTVFDSYGVFNNREFSLNIFIAMIIIYTLSCPFQEIIARGVLQGPISEFVEGSELKKMLVGIICSNAVFSLAHSYLSLEYSLAVFLAGIFWGWLYHRHKTLIGVTISHIMLGVWTGFFVSIDAILR